MKTPKYVKVLHTPSGKFRMVPDSVARNKTAMELGRLVVLEDEEASEELIEAREEYLRLTGKEAPYRWDIQKIEDKISLVRGADNDLTDVDTPSREDLVAQYESIFGKKPPKNSKDETILSKINEAINE